MNIMEHEGLKTISESFTPVRRKESTLNDGRFGRDAEKEWTAARCNRLLRPLTSRIAILCKAKQDSLNCMKVQSKKGKWASDPNIDTPGKEITNNNAGWVGRKRVKRKYSGRAGTKRPEQPIANAEPFVKVASNGRGSSSSVPGEIVVPTPLLNRAWRKSASPYRAIPYKGNAPEHCQQMSIDSVSDRQTKARVLGASKTHTTGSQALCKIRNTMSPARFNIYEGIYNGLEGLLRATHPIAPKGHEKGPKSLLSLCLATVPKYITMEEKLLYSEIERVGSYSAIEKRDISTEIYDDLELFGSCGRGWKHLQSVVRSHGVQMIRDAILGDLLEYKFCEILVDLCIYSGHHEEAELILSSLLSAYKFPAPYRSFSDHVSHGPLSKIRKFVEVTNRTWYEYRQISILIKNGTLPLPWVATAAFTPIWNGLMQDLLLDHARADAAMFMNTVLPCLVEYLSSSDFSSDADLYKMCRSTLLTVLTTISSIILLGRGEEGFGAAHEWRMSESMSDNEIVGRQPVAADSPLGSLTTHKIRDSNRTATISDTHSKLLKDCVRLIRRNTKETDLQSTILLLACLVTEPNAEDISDLIIDTLCLMYEEDTDDENLSAEIPSRLAHKTLYNEAVSFLSSVARCCGKGASTSGFEYLQYIHWRLKMVTAGRRSKAMTIWHGIIVDSAFAFAQATPGQKYLDYADSLDGELHAESSKRPGGARKEAYHEPAAFRWEEGISSWVTATPAINNSKFKIIPINFQSDEAEFESPSSARSQRPVQLTRGTKRKCDDNKHDQPVEPETKLTSRCQKRARGQKAATFNVWNCDSGDDELNSSYESSENTHVLKNLQNVETRRRSKLRTKSQKASLTTNCKKELFSEDELGI
ncbi:e7c71e75-b928-490f-aa05-6feb11f97d34 [Sclerotinia trifoliorum]|uniref:E7c71e75-b928-490f-aa05-6feb11f97d34 n=1 Tax=Sclerotinia trifoliorum TaxID=28548 RepID=A0A8H2VQG0_9HELO|nr:e7c71e75-b928-490f-aa05-6feb11f97d34 [Sclerotinia trifoliorum]